MYSDRLLDLMHDQTVYFNLNQKQRYNLKIYKKFASK